MKKKIQECHICKNKFVYNAIGRHYKYKHLIDLSIEENYLNYFNYNNPNFIEKIINECNEEKKSVNILLKEKYSEIGEGTINRLQSLLKNKIDVTREDVVRNKTKVKNKTCILKYGEIYSKEFKDRIGGFAKDNDLAKRASLIARNDPKIKKIRSDYVKTDIFKEKRKNSLIERYGTLIIRQSSTSKWHLKIKKCLNYMEYLQNMNKIY